jgi:hypothetical protein
MKLAVSVVMQFPPLHRSVGLPRLLPFRIRLKKSRYCEATVTHYSLLLLLLHPPADITSDLMTCPLTQPQCLNSLKEIESCPSNNIVTFFIRNQANLGLECCPAISTITDHNCWLIMLTSVGLTSEEANMMRGRPL